MTFPVPVDEVILAAEPADTYVKEEGKQEEPVQLPTPRTVSLCPSCDGSGLWRGIDGYVFTCQHCVYEMT